MLLYKHVREVHSYLPDRTVAAGTIIFILDPEDESNIPSQTSANLHEITLSHMPEDCALDKVLFEVHIVTLIVWL
jgi:hypothetical protein